MRNLKKFLTLALAVVMVVSVFAFSASAAQFTDVDENNEYLAKAVNLLSNVGITKGTSETTYGTEELVTREQMAAFIYRLMKKGQSVEGGANNTRFTDLQDPTFFFMISWADNQGIIKGTSATTFNPKGSITLQDAYTMIVRALGYEKEETLPYPFGYIDVAEQDGVELDEGLDSSVGYTDALTRGDVAIILYNAFFAETGVAETYNEERQLKDDDGKVVNIVLESKTRYPALCEKVFDVLNVEYQAVATPKYVFDDAATETTGDLGYEAIQFVLTDDDMTSDEKDDAPVEFYASFDELNLPGTADDYIMSKFNMYIKADDNELDSILYAEPLLVKKTVSDIKLDQVTTNKAGSYYGNDTDGAKRLSGKATIGGKVAYFFDAPYSYAQPTYTGTGDIARYNDRNEKNLKFINFELLGTADDGEYKFVKEDDLFLAGADIYADDDEKDFHVSDSEALIEKLLQVYTGGLYEATVYDVDGDGIYDYINYMPYSYAIVDTDDDYTFEEDGFGDDDVIYTTDAFVEGEKFEDEDFIVGYFNQDANYIKVAYVIEPVETKVSSYRKNTGIVTLANGDKVSAEDGWKYVDNYLDGEAEGLKELNYSIDDVEWQLDELLSPSALDLDKNAKFYVYDGVVLYQEGVDNKVTFDSNLIVLTNDPDNDDQVFDTSSLIVATGKKTTYAYAWVDGETKYVPIDTDADVWPKIKDYINVDNDENPYFNKIATYTVDGDGLYTIKLLGNAYDESEMTDDDYIGIDKDPTIFKDDKDDTLQYYGETTDEVTLTRRSTGIFDVNLDVVSQVKLTDTSIVLIKSTYYDEAEKEDVTEFVKLGLSNFKDTLSNKLTNVQFILENDPDTTRRENLVVLYGETNEEVDYEGKTSAKDIRIIKYANPDIDENGKYRVFYDVYDPYTGKVYTDDAAVAGSKTYATANAVSEKFSYGDVVELKGGEVNESKSAKGNVTDASDLYLILEYFEDGDDSSITVTPYADYTKAKDDATELEELHLTVDYDTVVTKLGDADSSIDSAIKWGKIEAVDASKLASSDKSLLALNKNVPDRNNELKTKYAKYQKAYISIDTSDALKNENDGTAEYIVILVNASEPIEYIDAK